MKKVLWISRHEMTPSQYADLERVMGADIAVSRWPGTVNDVAELLPEIKSADAVAAVLPLELLAQLVREAGDRPVLQASSARVPTGRVITLPDGRKEPEYAFVHSGWQQLVRLELEMRKL